ncbi:YcxB family protein [Luteimonas huabeiensis]|uniref:YcxB family protein n=1 Tax=Luteimonas huabeiensis TaxID=1244513 RepID=UPI0004642451|nr:YcxB family protein [Luteimonas huabeiensis]
MAPQVPLAFEVAYRLREYLAFAVDHAVDTDAFVRRAPRWKVRLFRIALAGVASVAFLVKTRRHGACRFEIDADGLRRTTRRGTSGVPWTRVKAVHLYRPGYLIELREGAVPIPFRALDPSQRAAFEAFAGPRLARSRPGACRGA